MSNNNANAEKFLDVQELSALENETVRGGASELDVEVKKEKKKERAAQ